jgi:hypothetical protein
LPTSLFDEGISLCHAAKLNPAKLRLHSPGPVSGFSFRNESFFFWASAA